MSHAGTLRPQEFSYRTAAIRGRHAWWVRLDALGGQPARFATVTGRLQDGMAEVTTDNVSALTVVPERLPEGVDAIRVDGMQFNVPTKPLALVRRGGIWRTGAARGLLKREDLSGPFSDVLRGQSLIVYGTAGDDDLRKQMVRDEAMRLAADAGSRYGLKATVKPDTEVTDEDRARVNLVLIGGPDVNAVSAEVADSLPVKLQAGHALVGEQSFDGDDLGLLLCYPNPANPERMVALVAGATPAALYQAVNRLSWASSGGYKWFDYAVFDSRTAGPDSCLALGIFDSRWRLPSASGGAAWTAEPAARDGLLPQHFPALQSLAASQEAAVYLSDVRPSAIDLPYGAVAFDRTRAGRAIRAGEEAFDKGLGVGAPSSLIFVLGGRFTTFKATPLVSAAPDGAPGVIFEVVGDGEVLAVSGPVRAGQNVPVPIQADLTGISSLTLRVRPDSAAPAGGVDCVWAGAQVSR